MIYGMYWCLNVVTEESDFPAAVLIRALEPIAGQAEMKKRRRAARTDVDLCNGPGKLCQAMDVDSRFHGQSIEEGTLWLEQDPVASSESMDGVVSCPRVGVDYAGECARYPWRYYLASSECVSKRDRLAESERSAR
jgi:DNA-3-methyladenine glycosylase